MPKWEIKEYSYDDLPPEIDKEFLPENGGGPEYANYLVLYKNGKVYDYATDAMEPEDAVFFRDLKFIKQWIETIIKRS